MKEINILPHHTLDPDGWNSNHRKDLIQQALGKVNDYQIAEDLVQETFLAAWKGKDRFRGECSEKTFLSGILRNKVVDFYRSRGRRPTVYANQLENDDRNDLTGWMDNRADLRNDLSPTLSAEKRDFLKDLNTAVAKLPEKMSEAFRLWQMQELSTQEVTRSMNITNRNLWVMIHRAKKTLKEELGSEWGDASFTTPTI